MEVLNGTGGDLEILASAALPAAGAWQDSVMQDGLAPYTRLALLVTYTLNAASAIGRPQFRVDWQVDTGTRYPGTLDVGAGDYEIDLRRGPIPPDATAQEYVIRIDNPGAMDRLIVSVRENGDVPNPGTIRLGLNAMT